MEEVFSRTTNLFFILFLSILIVLPTKDAAADIRLTCDFSFTKNGASVSANNLSGEVNVNVDYDWAYTPEIVRISVGTTTICRRFTNCALKTTDFQNGNHTIKCSATAIGGEEAYATDPITIANTTPQVSLSILEETNKKYLLKALVDYEGQISNVKFSRNGGNTVTDTSKPYKFNVLKHQLNPGVNTIIAVATARNGLTGQASLQLIGDSDPNGDDDDDDGGDDNGDNTEPVEISLSFPDQDEKALKNRIILLAKVSDNTNVKKVKAFFTTKRNKEKKQV